MNRAAALRMARAFVPVCMLVAMAALPATASADLAPGKSDKAQCLAVSPAYKTDRTLFVGGYYEMWKSTDGGGRFSVLSSAPKDIVDIVISPAFAADKTLLVAATGNIYGVGAGIYRSTNGGTTWQDVSSGLPASHMPYRLRISPSFATDRIVIALVNTDLYKSTNGGASWTKITVPVGAYQMAVYNFDISPAFGSDGYMAAVQDYNDTIAYSSNRGGLWTLSALGSSWNLGFDGVCFSSNFAVDRRIWATKSGTVFRSTDAGANFTKIADQYGVIPTKAMVSSPRYVTDSTLLAGGSRSSGTPLLGRSTDGGVTWTTSQSGLAGQQIEDIDYSTNFAADHTVFAVVGMTYSDGYGGAFVSRNSGTTWARLGGIPAKLGTPKLSKSKPVRKQKFYVSGTLPYHSAATSVKLQFFRKGSKGYPSSPKTTLTVSAPYGATKFKKPVKLSSAGSWYVRVYHKDADHQTSYSAKKYFKVR